MKQFAKILRFELKNYLANKVFVGITLFLVVLIAGVMFIPRILSLRGEDTAPETLPKMLLVSDSADHDALLQEAFTASFPEYRVELCKKEDIQPLLTAGDAECAFVMDSLTSYTYYVNTLSLYDANPETADAALQNVYGLDALIHEWHIPPEQAGALFEVSVEHGTVALDTDQRENFFYTYIMIFALYMVILLYGQMVATNVATEKSSRAMELLITSARPTAMMFGKVIASCLAGLMQLVAVFGSAFLFFNLNRTYWADNMIVNSIFNMPLELLGYMLLFFVLGFFIYAFMYGAVGSTASKLEDINTSVMPITMLFIIAFMVVMFSLSSGDVNNPAILICSYVPFTSPMAMFTRIAMSAVPWYEILASVVILIGSVIGIGVLAARIYRVGVLLYGTTPKIGTILKMLWRK